MSPINPLNPEAVFQSFYIEANSAISMLKLAVPYTASIFEVAADNEWGSLEGKSTLIVRFLQSQL